MGPTEIGAKIKRYAKRMLRGPALPLERFDASGVEFTSLFPSRSYDFGREETFDGQPIAFAAPLARTHPALGIFRLSNAVVRSRDGYVLSERNRWLSAASWFGEEPAEIRRNPQALAASGGRAHRLHGQVLSLASEFAGGNYGHFLLDSIGRLAIVREANLELSSFDAIIVNGPDTAWKRRLLTTFNVPLAKLVWTDERDLVCERLVVTSFPGVRRSYAPWLVSFLRQSQAPATDGPRGLRLFLSRSGTSRRLVNEAALLEVAQKHGFVRYMPEHAADSIAEIGNAEAIISPHGAGMSDIAFMRPGAAVVELIPSDHRYGYYLTLARSAELLYSALIGKSTIERPAGSWGPSTSDFSVEPEQLRSCLDHMLKGATA